MPVLSDPTLPEEEIRFIGVRRPKSKDEDGSSNAGSSDSDRSRSGNESEETPLVTVGEPGVFNPSAYIDLTGKDMCRAIYKTRINSTSGWIPLVCGRTDCSFHANAKDFGSPRIYHRQPKGNLHHGRMDLPSYSTKEFKDKVTEFEKVMAMEAEIGATFTPTRTTSPIPAEDASSSEQEETPSQRSTRRVSLPNVTRTTLRSDEEVQESEPPVLTQETGASANDQAGRTPPSRVHIDTGANTIFTPVVRPSQPEVKTTKIYYGLESRAGEREVLQDQAQALHWGDQEGWEVMGMWTDPLRASTWLSKAPIFLSKIDLDTEIETSRAKKQRKETQKPTAVRPTRKKKSSKGDPSDDDENGSESSDHHQQKKEKKSKRGKGVREKKKKNRRQREESSDSDEDPSGDDSDPSSSSDSSTSTSSSSSASQGKGRRGKGKKSKKKGRGGKGKRERKRKDQKKDSKTRNGPTLYGRAQSDPSVGTEDKVYGKHLTDTKLDRKLCPDGMPTKDRKEFADLLMDAANLPGRYQHKQGEAGELKEVLGEELKGVGDAIVSATSNRRTRTELNTQWKNENRTYLMKVSTEENLVTMMGRIHSGQKSVFKKQTHSVYYYMRECSYSSDEIEEYLQYGLWIRIIDDTYTWNLQLLQQIRHIASKHGTWTGLASAMIEHHGRKMADLRSFAVDYRSYLLELYIYLREGQKNNFQHPSLMEALWRVPAQIVEDHSNIGEEESKGRTSGCSHCRSKNLHDQMGVPWGKDNCPLKTLSAQKARKAVKGLLEHFKDNPNCDKNAYVKSHIKDNN